MTERRVHQCNCENTTLMMLSFSTMGSCDRPSVLVDLVNYFPNKHASIHPCFKTSSISAHQGGTPRPQQSHPYTRCSSYSTLLNFEQLVSRSVHKNNFPPNSNLNCTMFPCSFSLAGLGQEHTCAQTLSNVHVWLRKECHHIWLAVGAPISKKHSQRPK